MDVLRESAGERPWPVQPVHGNSGVCLRPLENQSIKPNYMQKITPFLWFDNQAEEAVKFYTAIFRNSRIGKIARYGEEGERVSGRPKGSVMTVEFQLEGQEFVALNGGPHFKFTEAISFVVNCKTQAEVDKFWKKLSAGGKEVQRSEEHTSELQSHSDLVCRLL